MNGIPDESQSRARLGPVMVQILPINYFFPPMMFIIVRLLTNFDNVLAILFVTQLTPGAMSNWPSMLGIFGQGSLVL